MTYNLFNSNMYINVVYIINIHIDKRIMCSCQSYFPNHSFYLKTWQWYRRYLWIFASSTTFVDICNKMYLLIKKMQKEWWIISYFNNWGNIFITFWILIHVSGLYSQRFILIYVYHFKYNFFFQISNVQ